MGRFFNYDNAVFSFLGKVADVMIVSALWLLCSLPIFTIGASTSALYYTMNKSVRHNRGYAWQEFFHAFKDNFKQGTIIWLIALGSYLLIAVDYYLVVQLGEHLPMGNVFLVVFLIILIITTVGVIYVFPYIARFENGTKQAIKNSLLMAIANLPRTILAVIIFAAALVAFVLIPVMSIFIPGIYMYLATLVLEPAFRKYMTPEDQDAEAVRNSKYIEDTYDYEAPVPYDVTMSYGAVEASGEAEEPEMSEVSGEAEKSEVAEVSGEIEVSEEMTE